LDIAEKSASLAFASLNHHNKPICIITSAYFWWYKISVCSTGEITKPSVCIRFYSTDLQDSCIFLQQLATCFFWPYFFNTNFVSKSMSLICLMYLGRREDMLYVHVVSDKYAVLFVVACLVSKCTTICEYVFMLAWSQLYLL
jgi:hypothetical protein